MVTWSLCLIEEIIPCAIHDLSLYSNLVYFPTGMRVSARPLMDLTIKSNFSLTFHFEYCIDNESKVSCRSRSKVIICHLKYHCLISPFNQDLLNVKEIG